MATFGERLKEYREKYDLQIQQLAELLGTSRQVIWGWERDKNSPRITTVDMIARRLNVPIEWLLGEDEPFDDFDPDSMTEQEIDLVMAYRIASPEIRTIARKVLNLE